MTIATGTVNVYDSGLHILRRRTHISARGDQNQNGRLKTRVLKIVCISDSK